MDAAMEDRIIDTITDFTTMIEVYERVNLDRSPDHPHYATVEQRIQDLLQRRIGAMRVATDLGMAEDVVNMLVMARVAERDEVIEMMSGHEKRVR